MLHLAVRQLRLDKGRSVLTCIGIAAVFAVILLLQGFQAGLGTQLRNVALERSADLIAMQAGIRNMIGARSVIPQMARGQVESVGGVRVAHPMTALPLIYENQGRKSAIFLMVTDSVGGPVHPERGRGLEGDGEILIDRSLARIFDLAPGDSFVIAGYAFEVAGVVAPTSALWTPFAFSNYDSLLEFYFEADLADDLSAFPLLSYLLIELEPGADPVLTAGAIEREVSDVDVFLPSAVADADEALGETMLGAVLVILVGAAYLAGILVVALFMYTAAEARRGDLGVLKALGFGSRHILTSLVAEAGILIAIAIPLGVVLAELATAAAHAIMPIYLILPTVPGTLARTIAACALFAALGAAGPWRIIRRLEPAEVFRT